jgi:carboxyl-terminal processing protease
VVHEAGHLLGLWHPTEEDGTEFDPLDDTPECDLAQFDTNSNGSVSAEECLGQGAENIMFWTSWPDGNQETFSEDQRFILRRSPLAFQGQLTEQTGDDITLTYDATLAETVANNASTVQSIQDMVELYDPECQRSTFPQTVDLILAQGCVSFQQTHYRPAYLPANLDNLNSVQDYVAVVNQNDRFSYYFEPVAYEETTQSLSGARSYIGFSYAVNDSEAVISASNPFAVDAIFPYTRAWWDGLRVGDQITAVDGVTISGLTVAEVRALLPSAEAEATVLTIARDGAIQTLETASETHLSRRLGTNNQIAYLNLREYTTVSGDNVRQDFEELLLSGSTPEALILDLRQNGGGSLLGALELTDYLGNASVDGEILFTFQTQSGGTPYRFGLNYDSDAGSYDATTLVVLTDGGSASASEVTSAALQDWNLATIMGDTTYGKGVGQSVVDLLDGSGVFITSFELLSPKGDSWHEVGVIPDQRVEGAAPSSPAEDTVLAAAIEFLETGALVSASRASRLPSEQMLEVPVSYTRPWDGGSRERLQ